ncbi:MAG: adenylyltransferase/cytidyltransferase family protein, partial [Deltaproteobacteria bacterium]|nr:adenylyltransferase/cytidyltransferase family protein [Deltaproteobacteria bacterium]
MPLTGYTVVYGGSFNPPHMGHQMACLYVLEALAAESVWLVPSRVHPFGKPLAPVEARVEMCRRMARAFGERVKVSLIEAQGEVSGRTYDTLDRLRRDHPQRRFALAIGADLVAETAQWYRWRDIEAMVRV